MKKTFIHILALLAIAGTAYSCAKTEAPDPKDEQEQQELVGKTIVFGVSDDSEVATSDEVETKAYFSDLSANDYSQIWSTSDAISVFDANGTNVQFTNTKTDDDVKALFRGVIPAEASTYYALYPYQSTATIDGTTITAEMPDAQVSAAGTLYHGTDPAALLSVAYSTSQDLDNDILKFMNCFSLIQFDITEDDITSVLIEGNNGEAIAGTFTVNVSDNPTITVTDPKTSVSLEPNEGGAFATGTYAIAMLPTTFSQGFKIIYKHEGSAKCSIKSYKSTSYTFNRNTSKDVNAKPFVSPNYKYYYILNKADLDAWKADKSNWASSDVVYLGADINYGHSTWECENFEGTFDGRNHSIYGIHFVTNSGRTGFFSTMTGTVKNVSFGSSDYNFSTDEGTYDTYSTIDHTSTSTSWNYAGAIAYCGNNGVIDNVVNFCPLNVSAACNAGDTRVAGIAGTMKNNGTITNCINYGDITINSVKYRATNNSAYDVAGVISRTDGTGDTITNCTNHGNILSYNTYIANYGGVLASLMNDATLSDLHNTGNITLAGSSQDAYLFIGGVIANINLSTTQSTTIDNCSNTGNIITPSVASTTTSKPSVTLGGVIGRIAGKSVAGLNNIDNSGSITNNIAGPASDTDGIRLGGLVGYAHQAINSGIDSESKNTGNVTNNANTGNKAYIGGIVGYVTASCGVKAENTGDVTNNGSVGDRLCMAGIMAAGTSGSTHTATNRGDVINNGAVSGHSVYMGGLMGYNSGQYTFDTCYNYGDIINEGVAKECCIGGMSGIMDNRLNIKKCKVYTATIKNTAAITDTLSIGGLVGEYWRSRTSNSSQVAFNTNKVDGASYVTNTADVGVLCMGGQIGNHQAKEEPDGQGSGYWKAECNATMSNTGNTTSGNIYIGGITGLMARAPKSFGSSDNKNNFGGSITNTGAAPYQPTGAPDNYYVCIGGNIGSVERVRIGEAADHTDSLDVAVPFDIQYTTNSGNITVNVSQDSDAQLFVGGICGRVLPNKLKSFKSGCSNSGNITVQNYSCTAGYYMYVAGVISNEPLNLSGCSNTGNITIVPKQAKFRVGGICGLFNNGSGTIENCTSECNISVGESGICAFVGGVIGHCYSVKSSKITNCTYKGNITVGDNDQSSGSGEKRGSAGGICGCNNTNMTFNACTVKAVISNGSNVYRGYFTSGANGSTKRTFTLGTDSNICSLVVGSKLGEGDAITTSSEPSFTDLTGNRYNNGGTATKDDNYQIISE